MMAKSRKTDESTASYSSGSAIVAVLGVVALLSLLTVSLLHSVSIERKTTAAGAAEEQARLAAESGASGAFALLSLATSNRPAYLVGLVEEETLENAQEEIAPALVIGATNLTSETQLVPLLSSDLADLTPFPKLPRALLQSILKKRLSTNPSLAVDLNDSSLIRNVTGPGGAEGGGGIIAAHGRYPAQWENIRDTTGKTKARYAFILTDESARLNPLLHRGNRRNDPVNWHSGPGDLPLTNGSHFLVTPEEAQHLQALAAVMPTDESFETAFEDPADYAEKRSLLTRDPCNAPDLIPPGLPEGGKPKYNLNDLATNPAWGTNPYARAENIAALIDRNLPKFKQRDPSLSGRGSDPALYLRRLACSMVDYISSEPGPTGPPSGEPSGRDLVPYVTQIAERCTLKSLTSNSTTIESRFFVELWNPTTSTIPAGGTAQLVISNRARLFFGTGYAKPFDPYEKTSVPLPSIRPNEFIVAAFDPCEQTWSSPEPTSIPPNWTNGPQGNADGVHHQSFELRWNGRLVDRSLPPLDSQPDVAGGLGHDPQTLRDFTPRWQCMTIPTWSANADKSGTSDDADEAIQQGSYRFVGDPRATFLTAYKWCVVTDYPSKSLWNGISPAGSRSSRSLMDPMRIWTRRDRVPVDPVAGNAPASGEETPDRIVSPYRADTASAEAPFVMRKAPMSSLGELGNIFDPAQVDDLGLAPSAGRPLSRFCSGGGRTLRIGQPEFHVADPKADWDVPGKRAIELLDLFTVGETGRKPGTNQGSSNTGTAGRINVNTAPHAVLTALFSGIGVASDRRFTNSVLRNEAAGDLAELVEEHRPYACLSDLYSITPALANATNYTPPLSQNVPGSAPPVADVFDRAREEAFGKIVGHCNVQTRVFRLVALGEALDRSGKCTGRAILEALVRMTPDASGRLQPSLHDFRWY